MSRVLIHGFTGSPASWDPVGVAGERVTLLGHGVDGPASWDEEIDRLAALVPEGAHVCGYSLGGRMALALLARGRAGRATLISTSAGLDRGDPTAQPAVGRSVAEPWRTDERARAERLAGDERWAQLAELDLERFLDEWEAQPLFATQRRLPPERLAAQRATRGAHTGAGLARSLRTVGLARMPNLWAALGTFDVPVDVVAGALDEKYVAHARRMASLLPRARLTIVPDAGHNLLLEAPAAIAAIVA